MAITKYKVIQKNLEAVINYAKNGEKTEEGILVSGVNCLPEIAYSQMMLAKKNFHKEDSRLGYHIIQSFNGKEVSPRKCNNIGVELARSLWGDKYQVLVCTHTNKDNIHNHIILNSVSFVDGSKYHNSNVEVALLREINDELCRKYGLSVIESKKSNKEKEIARSRIANYNRNSGKMELIKNDVDDAIKEARKYQDFVDIMQNKGYYIKKSNNVLSISSPYYNRNIRLARTFGERYTFDNIRDRIYYNESYRTQNNNEKIYKVKIYEGIKIDKEKLKTSSFYRLYVHYLYLLGKLPAKIHYEERTKEYYQEIDKYNKILDEISMININDFKTVDDVQNYRTKLLGEVAPLKAEKESLRFKYNKTSNQADKCILQAKINILTENIERYNVKIQTCRRIIDKAEKGEKEDKLVQKRLEENSEKNEKENVKNKDKKRIR